MSKLASLLERRAGELVQLWIARLQGGIAPEGLPAPVLRDHIPVLLQELVAALRGERLPAAEAVAREHGRQRYRAGFDLEGLVREHHALRSLVLDLAEEGGVAPSLAEFRVLSDFFAAAVSEGIVAFKRQREEAGRSVEEQHLKALRERERWLSTTLTSIGDAVIATGPAGRVTFLNPVAERLTGWTGAEARGRPLAEIFVIIHERTRAPATNPADRVLREGVVVGLENHTLLLRKDQSEIAIDDSAAPIRDDQGAVEGVVLVFRDASEKKRAEREAREREERMRGLLESTTEGIWGVDLDGRCSFANPACAALFGYGSAAELVGLDMHSISHHHRADGKPYPRQECPVYRTFDTALPVEVESEPFFRKDGSSFTARYRASPVLRRGRVAGAVVAFEDITARTALDDERQRLAALIEQSPDFIGLADADGAPSYVNPGGRRLVGLEGPANATALLDAYAPESRAQAEREILPAVTERQHWAGETALRHFQTGQAIPVFQTHFAIREPATGRLLGYGTVARDIRAQRQHEAEREALHLRERAARAEADAERKKLAALLEQAPAAICINEGPRHLYTFANRAYRALLGDRPLLGKTVVEAVPEAAPQGFVALLDGVLRTGEPFFGDEVPAVLANQAGEQRFYNFVMTATHDAGGLRNGVLSCAFEVTAQVQARRRVEAIAEQLRASEERVRQLVDASGTGTWELDVRSGELLADARFRALTGAPPGALTLTSALSLVHASDRERITRAVAAALGGESGGRYAVEERVHAADGSLRWIEARGQAVFDERGQACRLRGTVVDITARKQAEELLGRQARHTQLAADLGLSLSRGSSLQSMLQGCAEALVAHLDAAFARIWLLDRDKHDTLVLEASAGLYTHRDGAHSRVPVGALKIGRIAAEKRAHLTNAVVGDPAVADQEWARREGMVAFAGYPLLAGDRLVGVVALFARAALPQDTLDTLREAADRIALGVERLRSEQELKTRAEFEQHLVGIVSHDLRNPLNAILLGAGALAAREDLDDRSLRTISRVRSSAERATRMIRDLLDFTQARLGGGIAVRPGPVDLHALVRQVIEEVEVAFPGRQVEVRHEGNARGEWDGDRIAQVIANLVTNALKYSPEGTPVRVATRGGPGEVSLLVTNEGEPIPPSLANRIFEPLQRATADIDRSGRSVGLGLYIVKHIVEAHAGTVEVRSTAGEGTVVAVRLPRQAARAR